MRASATLCAGRERTRWRDAPPVVLRPTGTSRVHLVQAAGGPLGGDELSLDVKVETGADLAVRSAAATVVQPGPTDGTARWRVGLTVAAGATLRWAPRPTVICDGAGQHATIRARIDRTSLLVLRETVVLGRDGQRGGAYRGELDITIGGTPLLRHESVLDGADPALCGPAGTGGARVFGTLVVAGRGVPGSGECAGMLEDTRWASCPLAGPGHLVLALGPTVLGVERALTRAEAALEPVPYHQDEASGLDERSVKCTRSWSANTAVPRC